MKFEYLLFIIINFLFIFYFEKISAILNIYDYPDKVRKFHEKPVALIGGFLVLLNFFIYFFLFNNNGQFDQYIFFLISSFGFVGIIDDKINLNAYLKLFILIFLLFFFFHSRQIYLLSQIIIFNKTIYFNSFFSYFFTILCFLLFINSLNLFDGIDLQSISYIIFLFCILYIKNHYLDIVLISLITLTFLFFLNLKKKIFLGDSGIYILGSLIAILFIINYQINKNFTVEEIFILMMVPGIDMFRLFVKRIVNKKDPFSSDRNHLHHILLNVFGYKFTILFLIALFVMPYIFSYYYNSYKVIFFYFLIYFSLIYILENKIKKNN